MVVHDEAGRHEHQPPAGQAVQRRHAEADADGADGEQHDADGPTLRRPGRGRPRAGAATASSQATGPGREERQAGCAARSGARRRRRSRRRRRRRSTAHHVAATARIPTLRATASSALAGVAGHGGDGGRRRGRRGPAMRRTVSDAVRGTRATRRAPRPTRPTARSRRRADRGERRRAAPANGGPGGQRQVPATPPGWPTARRCSRRQVAQPGGGVGSAASAQLAAAFYRNDARLGFFCRCQLSARASCQGGGGGGDDLVTVVDHHQLAGATRRRGVDPADPVGLDLHLGGRRRGRWPGPRNRPATGPSAHVHGPTGVASTQQLVGRPDRRRARRAPTRRPT